MGCINEGLIQAYIDDEVSGEEKVLIENHISSCSECMEKIESQKNISAKLVEAINLLVNEPMVVDLRDSKKIKKFPLKKILYLVSAASILFFSIAIFKNDNESKGSTPDLYYNLDWTVDANRPITEQDFIISVFDADGNKSNFSTQ